jgi:hypothetical protein
MCGSRASFPPLEHPPSELPPSELPLFELPLSELPLFELPLFELPWFRCSCGPELPDIALFPPHETHPSPFTFT